MRDQIVCQHCGVPSTSGSGYQRRRGTVLCGDCAASARNKGESRRAWAAWLYLVAATVSWLSSPDSLVTALLVALCLPYVLAFGVTLIHESAHAIVATVLGLKVVGFRIGIGPRLTLIGGSRFHLDLRWLPVGGHTALVPEQVIHRGRQALTTIAGPLADAAVLVLVWNWAVPDGQWWPLIRLGLIWIIGAGLLVNLIPRQNLGNDGWRLSWLLTAPDQELKSASEVDEREGLALELSDLTGEQGDEARLRDIREDLLARLDDVGLGAGSRATILNNIAVANLKIGDPALLDEALELASEAVELLPFQPAILDTLGVALVRANRDREAIPLLQRALSGLSSDLAADGRVHLALAHMRQGNLFDARREYLLAGGAGGWVSELAGEAIAEGELVNLANQYPDSDAAEIVASLQATAGTDFVADLGDRLESWRQKVGLEAATNAVVRSGLSQTRSDAMPLLDELIRGARATRPLA